MSQIAIPSLIYRTLRVFPAISCIFKLTLLEGFICFHYFFCFFGLTFAICAKKCRTNFLMLYGQTLLTSLVIVYFDDALGASSMLENILNTFSCFFNA